MLQGELNWSLTRQVSVKNWRGTGLSMRFHCKLARVQVVHEATRGHMRCRNV